MKSKRLWVIRGFLGVALVSAGCGGSSPTSPTPPGGGSGGGGRSLTSVQISGNTTLSQNATSQLTARASYSDGTTQDVTNQATWRSSNAVVATVSATGLVTALQTGNADIMADYQGQSGRSTLQISAARFRLEVSLQSVIALDTCDDFTQGLDNGEFAVRIQAITPDGSRATLVETPAYPGSTSGPRGYNLGRNEAQSFSTTRTFNLAGEVGQFLRIQFNATEWDQQIVVLPPSIRWIHDDRMSDRSTSRSHQYANGSFSSLGTNSLTLGSGSCGIRLNYSVTANQQ